MIQILTWMNFNDIAENVAKSAKGWESRAPRLILRYTNAMTRVKSRRQVFLGLQRKPQEYLILLRGSVKYGSIGSIFMLKTPSKMALKIRGS